MKMIADFRRIANFKLELGSWNVKLIYISMFLFCFTNRRADLLSTLIKCTPSEHKDRQFIVKALKKLREISDNFKQVNFQFPFLVTLVTVRTAFHTMKCGERNLHPAKLSSPC